MSQKWSLDGALNISFQNYLSLNHRLILVQYCTKYWLQWFWYCWVNCNKHYTPTQHVCRLQGRGNTFIPVSFNHNSTIIIVGISLDLCFAFKYSHKGEDFGILAKCSIWASPVLVLLLAERKHQITKVVDHARLYPGEMCVYPRCDVAWREQSSTVDDPDKRVISL